MWFPLLWIRHINHRNISAASPLLSQAILFACCSLCFIYFFSIIVILIFIISRPHLNPYLYCRKQFCLHSQDGRPLDQPDRWTPWQPGNNIVIINTNITVLIILIVTVIITTNKIIHILIILIVSIIITGTLCGWLCSWKTSSSLDGIPSVISMIAWFDSAENWNSRIL